LRVALSSGGAGIVSPVEKRAKPYCSFATSKGCRAA
jgi:hypothetical protein